MRAPQYFQPECDAISWPHSTDGQKGMMVKTSTATYLPRLRVGASSEVTARDVSSPIPAPAPEIAMPAVKFPLADNLCINSRLQDDEKKPRVKCEETFWLTNKRVHR